MKTDKKKIYEKMKSCKKDSSEIYDGIIGLIYLMAIILVTFLVFYFICYVMYPQYHTKPLCKKKIIIKNQNL